MAPDNSQTIVSEGREISAERILNAPRELVWKVWADPEHIN